LWGYAISSSVSIVVVCINMIFTFLTIFLVKDIKYDTLSKEMTEITNYLFVSYFLNTGFVILLAYANTTEQFPLLSTYLNG
jgi:hypothetical protein